MKDCQKILRVKKDLLKLSFTKYYGSKVNGTCNEANLQLFYFKQQIQGKL